MRPNTITMIITLIYTAIFTAMSIAKGDTSFLIYTAMALAVLVLAIHYEWNKTFPTMLGAGLSLMGLLHMLGIYAYVNGTRLYDVHFGIIGYDNFMHLFYSGLFLLVAYHILRPKINGTLKITQTILILILVTAGAGAINEIIELIMVVGFNAQHLVGDYLNNAVDLAVNLLGALTAALIVLTKEKSLKAKEPRYIT